MDTTSISISLATLMKQKKSLEMYSRVLANPGSLSLVDIHSPKSLDLVREFLRSILIFGSKLSDTLNGYVCKLCHSGRGRAMKQAA